MLDPICLLLYVFLEHTVSFWFPCIRTMWACQGRKTPVLPWMTVYTNKTNDGTENESKLFREYFEDGMWQSSSDIE